jgi:hypothetical protein
LSSSNCEHFWCFIWKFHSCIKVFELQFFHKALFKLCLPWNVTSIILFTAWRIAWYCIFYNKMYVKIYFTCSWNEKEIFILFKRKCCFSKDSSHVETRDKSVIEVVLTLVDIKLTCNLLPLLKH